MPALLTPTVPGPRVMARRAWRAVQCAYCRFRIRAAEKDHARMLFDGEHLRLDLEQLPARLELNRKWTQQRRVQLAELESTAP